MSIVRQRVKRSKLWTFDEFCEVVPDGQKADLIEGAIYMASPDNTDAADLFMWIIRILSDFLDLRTLGGKLYGLRVAFRLDKHNSPEPDIAYVRPERLYLVQRGFVDGPPDVAMEIV